LQQKDAKIQENVQNIQLIKQIEIKTRETYV